MNSEIQFNKYLIEKYPNLFPKDSEGNAIQPVCGVYCPVGWYSLVDTLCEAISTYCCMQLVYTEKRKWWRLSKLFFFTKIFIHFYNFVFRKFDKDGIIFKSFYKLKNLLYPYHNYNTSNVPPVTIDQIKEKFGELRFYYQGGDAKVAGMVSFAEYLSSKTCQTTGARGSSYKKDGRFMTVSEEEAQRIGATKV